jgi:hypothetical protein
MTRISLTCSCGGSMDVRIGQADKAPVIEAIFREVHSAPECRVADRLKRPSGTSS